MLKMCLSEEVDLMTRSKFATLATPLPHNQRNPPEGLLRTQVLLYRVGDACSLDCCIATEKNSRAILFRFMIIACASEYAELACVEVTSTRTYSLAHPNCQSIV